ncbi:MAG TPA: GNAT family N-acetyltransferase [Chloroflexia bacterium]|nr:GNAT family N-acetyltransferase [Chloroflexia bacterium]
MDVEICRVVPGKRLEEELVHRLTRAAFTQLDKNLTVPTSAASETLEAVREELARPDSGGILAWLKTEPERQAVATARFRAEKNYLYVGRVAVDPPYQGRGIGQQMMQYLEQVALSLGKLEIHLATRASLPGNISFYQRLGYIITSSEPHSRGDDVVVNFSKHLAVST